MVAQAQDTFTPAIPAPGGTPGALTPQERGRLGGQATFARYGREHLYVICNPSGCRTPDPRELSWVGMGGEQEKG